MTRPTSPEAIEKRYVGKTLGEVPTPCAVLDRAKVEANCQRMLDAVEKLNIGWRAHVKSHKTIEITRLQVGDKNDTPVKVIVSTLLEAEKLLPLLKEYQENGREVNVLYSFPLFPSCVSRIAALASELGPGAVSVLIDHPDQIPSLAAIRRSGTAVDAFLKINMGNNRAGVIPRSDACRALVARLLAAHDEGACRLAGLYAHAGHSYATRRTWEAMEYLAAELFALRDVAADVREQQRRRSQQQPLPLVLSAGATPTATSLQHPHLREENTTAATTTPGEGDESDLPGSGPAELETLIAELRSSPSTAALEVHAGVYPLLDLQQLATHARSEDRGLAASDLALTVLAEVASVYPGRGYDGTAEALINAGSLALGREPCRDASVDGEGDYAGWGILMPWRQQAKGESSSSTTTSGGGQKKEGEEEEVERHVQIWPGCEFPHAHGGWEVARISQEHGTLAWCGAPGDEAPLRVGQRVRVWPNHACIAGAMFDRYLVVDSRLKGREDEIVDVWERWRGW
ncbi:uncharacterized protein E0L32_010129 [Thyridium curvatum]|uniref:D-serine dehydratase-like domain-containing protein n=1 Tax=Thyridium curvatum TaxID=1093900 RepID=A0A507AU04_9PEZI|nr:uncharacterized protein E0L32_010129 [Thyridium curvatum]TPX08399.1 hypothetical protein E0L32_010129 [Thyridium curvatum]